MSSSITDLMAAFPPSILVSPTSLVFTTDEGLGFGEEQDVQVTNVGSFGSLLVAALTTSASYLTTTPTSLTNLASNESGIFQVDVDSTTLLASDSPYTSTVLVQDATAGNSPQSVSVTVVVRPKATITLTPVMLIFNVIKPISGPFPAIPSQTFTLQNTGLSDSVLAYLIQKLTGCSPWLVGINPFSGTLAGGASQLITVTVAPDITWPVGQFNETLRVSGYSTNSYQDIIVQLNVT